MVRFLNVLFADPSSFHRTGCSEYKTSSTFIFLVLYSITITRCVASNTTAASDDDFSSEVLEFPFVRCNGGETHECFNNSTLLSNNTKISNVKCLPLSLLCDGKPQCPDWSDERDCKEDCATPHWFRCHNAHCISTQWRCDGENDCMDWSDEDDCSKKEEVNSNPEIALMKSCQPDEFKCIDGRCISQRWTCDRQHDCEGGEDESKDLCTSRECLVDTQFMCSNGECVSNSWVCDGISDCEDNSDESSSLCSGRGYNGSNPCDTVHEYFLCKNTSDCISKEKVCDGETDCKDNSDEEDYCQKQAGQCAHFGCTKGCVLTPAGPTCYCPGGYALAPDGKSCLDVNECEEYGICSQTCTNYPGTFSCSCLPGYSLTNDGSCLAADGETLLLFSTKTEVRGLSLSGNRYFSVATNLPHVIGVGFDSRTETVYWTDVMAGRETIVSKKLDGTNWSPGEIGTENKLVTSGLDMPEDLVVDGINGNLYLTDSIARHIAVCSLELNIGCAILETDVEQPRAIALHYGSKLVLFTDWGDVKKCIGTLRMDGTARVNLVTEKLGWPNGLAVDDILGRVFWSDAKHDTLESIKLDGTDRRVVLDSVVKHPFSLAVFEDRLYWSDWENKDVVSCNKFTGKDLFTHVKEIGVQPFGITISNPIQTKNITSPCQNHSCSHLCLPTSKSYRCRCPDHLILGGDSNTCIKNPSATAFLVSTNNVLFQFYPQTVGLDEFTTLANTGEGTIGGMVGTGLDNTVLTLVRHASGQDDITVLDRSQNRLVHAFSGSLTGSIAYDSRSRTVYWTDFKKNAIFAHPLIKRESVQIVDGLVNPLSILVVPEHNKLVLGELGRVSILPLGPHELDSRVIVSSKVASPTCLGYNPSIDALFIGDSGARSILRWDWGKKEDPVSIISAIGEITDMVTKDNFVYWIEKGKPILFWIHLDMVNKETAWMSLEKVASLTDILHLAISGNNTRPGYWNKGCLASHCSHLCVPGEKSNDYSCNCPFGMNLARDLHTCQPDCPDNVFNCGDGQCIMENWKCDGTSDCNNKADEKNCSLVARSTCDNSTHFACDNGACLLKRWFCDGDIDCTDGSDEKDSCPSVKCDEGKFMCKDGKQCLLLRWKCDGDLDCRDESDEDDCGEVKCLESEFSCKDGLKCIQGDWRCDGVPDCHDASDEENCKNATVQHCAKAEFKCNSGDCVDLVLMCDGQDDCGDGSEESAEFCHNRTEDVIEGEGIDCRGRFQCGFQCLPSFVRCNGTSECSDESDETDCPLCTRDTFRCNNGNRCVPSTWLCDQTKDCSDGSDEWDCEYNRNIKPSPKTCDPESEFLCLSGECMPLDRVCDNIPDCNDGSDEDLDRCSTNCPSPKCVVDQICQPTPRGAVCICRPGYSLSDGQCEDKNECDVSTSCAQLCTNTKGSYKCKCEEGFVAESRTCRTVGVSPKFMYAADNTIKTSIEGRFGTHVIHRALSTHARELGSFVYNENTEEYFWTIPQLGMIGRRKNGTKNEIWIKNLQKPSELALDWREDNLYYSSRTSNIVHVCSIRNKICAELPRIPQDAVTKIVADPRSGKLFIAAHSRMPGTYPSAVIYPFTMDGRAVPEASVIGEPKTGVVTGLALDAVKQLVFWADITSRDIRVCTYLGTDCGVVSTSSQRRPTGLVLLSSKLFWTTANFPWLHSHQIIWNVTNERTFSLPTQAHSLTFSHPALQPLGRFPSLCSSMDCSQICVLSSPTEARCVCSSVFSETESGIEICSKIYETNPTTRHRSLTSDDPSVVSINNNNYSTETILVVVVVLLFLIILGLCLIFLKCRKTKGGTELGIRFTNMTFGLTTNSSENGVELDGQRVNVERSSNYVGYKNPYFESPIPAQNSTKPTMAWPDSPDINGDSPVIMAGHSTPRLGARDTDSAYPGSYMASSYEDDEKQHLSVANYKDKQRLLSS